MCKIWFKLMQYTQRNNTLNIILLLECHTICWLDRIKNKQESCWFCTFNTSTTFTNRLCRREIVLTVQGSQVDLDVKLRMRRFASRICMFLVSEESDKLTAYSILHTKDQQVRRTTVVWRHAQSCQALCAASVTITYRIYNSHKSLTAIKIEIKCNNNFSSKLK